MTPVERCSYTSPCGLGVFLVQRAIGSALNRVDSHRSGALRRPSQLGPVDIDDFCGAVKPRLQLIVSLDQSFGSGLLLDKRRRSVVPTDLAGPSISEK